MLGKVIISTTPNHIECRVREHDADVMIAILSLAKHPIIDIDRVVTIDDMIDYKNRGLSTDASDIQEYLFIREHDSMVIIHFMKTCFD